MRKRRICIDMSHLIPGKGGSGGGITTYSQNLLKHMDAYAGRGEVEVMCLRHQEFKGLDDLKNIQTVTVTAALDKPLVRALWLQLYLPFFCYRNKVDVLHRVTPEIPLVKACTYICTVHDLMFDFYLSSPRLKRQLSRGASLKFRILRRMTGNALAKSDRVIVPSAAIKEEAISRYGVPGAKIEVIHEASDKDWPYREPSYNSPVLRIAVIAGFYPHKGHLKVLELVKKLVESGFNELHVYFRGNPGFDNYLEEVRKTVRDLSLTGYVTFVPFTAQVREQDIYASYDVVMLLSEYEGFGLPVLEAQAHQIPLFCSDIPVFREILGDSAFFVRPDLDQEGVREIREALTNPRALAEFVIRGRENIGRYSWDAMSARTYALYTATANHKP